MKLTAKECAAESRSICRRVLEALPEGAPLILCAYYPMPSEPDIRPIFLTLLKSGHTIFFPCFTRTACAFRQFTAEDGLINGPLGVLEPPTDAPALEPEALDIALIPGRAFGLDGGRMGRGNGGYDRWIEKTRIINPTALFWGVCFDFQLERMLPTEAHDEPMDAIISPRMKIEGGRQC